MPKQKKQPYILRRTFGFFNENISIDDINVAVSEEKDDLNELIWDNNHKLKKSVRKAMLKITKSFYDFLKLDESKIKDVVFTGSMANYNWTSVSDIDIHVILNLDYYNDIKDIIEEYLFAKKSIWNDKRNIYIKGFEVEMYAKEDEEIHTFKGIYSVLKDKWIQKPKKFDGVIDEDIIKEKTVILINKIEDLKNIKNANEVNDKIEKIKTKLRNLRKSGLEKGGEYSIENLTFKTLRKSGYLNVLSDISKQSIDKSLSLTEKNIIKESQYTKYEKGCLMLSINIDWWGKILEKIKKDDVYDKQGFGLEHDPHITVLYGFVPETNPDEIKKFVQNLISKNINIKLTDISLFENPQYDVIKFNIISDDLVQLNNELRNNFEYVSDYPDYNPHITISYIKKGQGKKYCKKLKNEYSFSSSEFIYSYPPNKKIKFNITNNNRINIERGVKDMTEEKINIIKKFINFVCNRLEMQNPVNLFLHKDRDEYIGTTASYCPSDNTNHIRCNSRSLVDILRSIAHELVHNRQREIESYKNANEVQNIGGWIEDEANAKAGVLIKDFAINFGNDKIYDM